MSTITTVFDVGDTVWRVGSDVREAQIRNILAEMVGDTNVAGTPGSQQVTFSPPLGATDLAGLVAGSYDFIIAVNGGTALIVTYTSLGTETIDDILTVINSLISGAVVTLSCGNFVFTSTVTPLTVGVPVASSIDLSSGTVHPDLFTALATAVVGTATIETAVKAVFAETTTISYDVSYTHTGARDNVVESTLYATVDDALAAYKTLLTS